MRSMQMLKGSRPAATRRSWRAFTWSYLSKRLITLALAQLREHRIDEILQGVHVGQQADGDVDREAVFDFHDQVHRGDGVHHQAGREIGTGGAFDFFGLEGVEGLDNLLQDLIVSPLDRVHSSWGAFLRRELGIEPRRERGCHSWSTSGVREQYKR